MPRGRPQPDIVRLVETLDYHPTAAYSRRARTAVRYVVLHHSGAGAVVRDGWSYTQAIARYHVRRLGWPGIGYHLTIGQDGEIYQTQDLTTISYHAGQPAANAYGIGICLLGNFIAADPTPAQLTATRTLFAYLEAELSRPLAVHPHRRFALTACPGKSPQIAALFSPSLQTVELPINTVTAANPVASQDP